jgi:DNA-binding CsgD family transcriptional regulator
MPPTETELLRLALMAYEAAAEPELWPRFLELYNDAVFGDAVVLQVHDLGLNRSSILAGFGISSPLKQSYNEHYSKLNVWRQRGREFYYPGAANLDQEQCPRPVLERSEFYNDYLRRIGAAHSMGAIIARRQNQAPTLTALRGPQKGAFGEDERKVAKFLLPYLSRAWALHEKLELIAAGESVLDRLPIGVVFLGAGADAVYVNLCAEEIFRANDGLSLANGELSASDRAADTQLRRAIDHSLSPDQPFGSRAVGARRASGRRAYQVVIAPLRTRLRQFTGTAAPLAVVLITDPEQPGPAKLDLLVQLYGLTPKEAEIAVNLSQGKTVEQTAEQLGMTYQTARTHLRRLFIKTGTSRQTELLLLLARLPGSATSSS